MGDRGRLFLLTVFMVGVAALATGTMFWTMHRTAHQERNDSLLDIVVDEASDFAEVLPANRTPEAAILQFANEATWSRILGPTGRLLLVERNEAGELVVRASRTGWGEPSPEQKPLGPAIESILQRAVDGTAGAFHVTDTQGRGILLACAPVVRSSFVVAAEVPASDVEHPYVGDASLALAVALVAALVAALLFHRMARRVFRRLEHEERRFTAVFDSAHQLFGLLTPDGRILEANRNVLALNRLSREEMIGRLFWEAPCWREAAERQEEVKAALARAASGETVCGFFGGLDPEDNPLAFEYSLKPLMDASERVEAIIVEAHDITERQRAENTLRHREHELRTVLEHNPDFILRFDSNLRFTYVNPAFTEAVGISLAEAAGKTGGELGIPDTLRQQWIGALRETLASGKPVRFEAEVPTTQGPRWYQARIVPELDSSGEVTSLLAVSREITDRVRAEKALRESEGRLALALDGATLGTWDWDLATGRIVWTGHHGTFFGLADGGTQTTSYRQIMRHIHPDDVGPLNKAVRHARVSRQTCEQVFRVTSPADGSLHWLLGKGRFVYDNAGRVTRVAGIVMDVTDPVRAENELRRREAEFRALVENAQDVIIRLDRDLRILYANPAIEKATGLKASDLIGLRPPNIPASDELEEKGLFALRGVLETGREETVDSLSPTPIGPRWFQSRIVPEFDPAGGVESLLIVSRDLTDIRTADETASRLAAIVESSADAVYGLTSDGCISSWNAAAERLYGYEAAEAIGQPVWILVPPDREEEAQRNFAEARTGGRIVGFETLRRTKGGQLIDVALTLSPVRERTGRISGISVIARDVAERIHQERALRESERRLRTLVANLPGMAYRCVNRPDWAMEFVSGGCKDLTGYDAAELTDGTRPYAEIIHEDDRDRVWAVVQRGTAEGRPYRLTYRIVTATGQERFVWEQGQAVYGDDGTVTALEGFITDITDRRQAEVMLAREAEINAAFAYLASALLSSRSLKEVAGLVLQQAMHLTDSPVGFAGHPDSSSGGRVEAVVIEGSCFSLAGGSPEADEKCAALRRAVLNRREPLLANDSAELAAELEAKACPLGPDRIMSMPALLGDELLGQIAVANASQPYSNSDQGILLRLAEIYAVAIEQRRTREAVERAESLLSGVLNSAIDALMAVRAVRDEEGRITDFECLLTNSAVEDLTGQPIPKGTEGMRLRDAVPAGFADELSPHYVEIAESGQTHDWEFRLDVGPRPRWYRCVAARLGDGVVGRISDITERMQLQDQLNQSRKMEAIGQLAGGVAHDFNNILTTILGSVEFLMMDAPEGSPIRRDLHEIRRAADRAAALTRQLLAFSRKQVLQPVVLNLNQAVAGAQKMLRRLIGEDVEFYTALAPDTWFIKADPGQIEQILLNLAVNARDAMPEGGRLTVETDNIILDEDYIRTHVDALPGPHAVLTVSDTGCGMLPEVRDHIFEPFFTTKEPGKGTGLGLATVYGIVKQSGGHICVYSEEGIGTTFRVYLPRAQEFPEAPEAVDSIVPKRVCTERILVVEDEEAVRKLARRILSHEGYTVIEAQNGEEALATVQEHPGTIDLLISDVVMPRMSGPRLVEALRSRGTLIRTLYMSGYTDRGLDPRTGLQPGTLFLQKPFTRDGLLKKVREALEG